ncbi:MAG TPA: hypothetical protein VNO23_10930, partial [Candidatus Binatia bacterium]|nr:hypothetical protein [Candidatus Binatia bacterium]
MVTTSLLGPIALLATLTAGAAHRPPAAEARHAAVEGFGAATAGGAGQAACEVTSLADSGPGTLRACLATGYRSVTFAVAGEIALQDWLVVGGPFVTVDGFTAPSPGITLRDWPLAIFRNIPGKPNAHDVIIRGIRVRHAANDDTSRDCISIAGPTFNIVIDHVSVARCGDGGIDVVQGARNITIQWSIISDDKAMLLGATSSARYVGTERISVHHNLFPSGLDRMPLVRPGDYQAADTTVDIRHNVFRGWLRSNATKIEARAWVNVVGNTYIPGPEATARDRVRSLRIAPGSRVYTAANVELGPPPAPDFNRYGNEPAPLPAPPITPRMAGCVVAEAGVRPLDALDG